MPAHTARWQVGIVRKGDGARLTAKDREGNDVADGLAKKGAALHRVPLHVRTKVKTAERVALRAALQLGVTTEAANSHAVSSLDSTGQVKWRLTRDCSGDSSCRKKPSDEKTQSGAAVQKSRNGKVKSCTPKAATERIATKENKVRKSRGKRKQPRAVRRKCDASSAAHSGTKSPTKEWLAAQGKLLTEAAAADEFQFLATVQDNAETESTQPSAFLRSILTTDRDWETRSRPCRAKAKAGAASAEKQAKKDVLRLIGL